jgi:hypothetical protein
LLSFGQQGYGLVEEGLSLEQKLKLLYARWMGKNLIGFDAMQRVDLLAQGDICGGQFLEGTPMDWIQAS